MSSVINPLINKISDFVLVVGTGDKSITPITILESQVLSVQIFESLYEDTTATIKFMDIDGLKEKFPLTGGETINFSFTDKIGQSFSFEFVLYDISGETSMNVGTNATDAKIVTLQLIDKTALILQNTRHPQGIENLESRPVGEIIEELTKNIEIDIDYSEVETQYIKELTNFTIPQDWSILKIIRFMITYLDTVKNAGYFLYKNRDFIDGEYVQQYKIQSYSTLYKTKEEVETKDTYLQFNNSKVYNDVIEWKVEKSCSMLDIYNSSILRTKTSGFDVDNKNIKYNQYNFEDYKEKHEQDKLSNIAEYFYDNVVEKTIAVPHVSNRAYENQLFNKTKHVLANSQQLKIFTNGKFRNKVGRAVNFIKPSKDTFVNESLSGSYIISEMNTIISNGKCNQTLTFSRYNVSYDFLKGVKIL